MIVRPPKITSQVDELYLSFPLLDRNELFEARGLVAKWRKSEKKLSLSVSQYHKPRSNDANAYMWVLCQAIAEAVKSTKEEVYRAHIRDYGEFDAIVCPTKGAQRFASGWGRENGKSGTGWFCDLIDNYDGTTTVLCYYGSSTYNTKQMSTILDSLISECDELGLEVQITDSVRALLNDK